MGHKVKLIWTSHSHLDVGQQVQLHKHFCCQIYYILSGSLDFVIGKKTIHANAGSFLYIPQATLHRICEVKDHPVVFYEMKALLMDTLLTEQLKNASEVSDDSGLIKHYLTYVIENSRCSNTQNQENIEYILTTLLMRFFIQDLQYTDTGSCLVNTENYDSVVRSVIAYIERNYTGRISLQKMGDELNYNKNYLSTIFTKKTGISIIDYLNFVRIRQAIIFLIYYNQDIYTTGESIGFSSTSYFTRTFKSLVGIAPHYFRQAFSASSVDCISDFFSDNHTLNYQPCSIEEGFQSLRDIGQTAISILKDRESALSTTNQPFPYDCQPFEEAALQRL